MVSLAVHRLASPLGNRDFRILWLGQGISALGDPLQAIAVAWLVLDGTGSAKVLASALIALTVPRTMVALVGGIATDRYSPRMVMFWCDVARAGAIGLLTILAYAERLELWILCCLLATTGVAGGIFSPAATSIVPDLVSPGHLQPANALMQMTPQLALILGTPLAGILLVTGGPASALGLNAVSFAIAAASAWFLRCPERRSPPVTHASLGQEVVTGVVAVWRSSWLRTLLGVDALLTMAVSGPLSVGLPVLVRSRYEAGPETYSMLLVSFGMGSVLGMGYLGARSQPGRPAFSFCLLQLAQAPLIAVLIWRTPWLAAIALFTIGLLHGLAGVIYLTMIQKRVPGEIRGRVMSVMALVAFGLVPLSQVLTGTLSGIFGIAGVFLLAAALMAIGSAIGTAAPVLRRFE